MHLACGRSGCADGQPAVSIGKVEQTRGPVLVLNPPLPARLIDDNDKHPGLPLFIGQSEPTVLQRRPKTLPEDNGESESALNAAPTRLLDGGRVLCAPAHADDECTTFFPCAARAHWT